MRNDMKRNFIELYEKLGKQLDSMNDEPQGFFNAYNNSPESLSIKHVVDKLKGLGFSDVLCLRIAHSIKFDINTYDKDVFTVYVDRIFIPVIKGVLSNHLSIEIYKDLSLEESLIICASKSTYQYKT